MAKFNVIDGKYVEIHEICGVPEARAQRTWSAMKALYPELEGVAEKVGISEAIPIKNISKVVALLPTKLGSSLRKEVKPIIRDDCGASKTVIVMPAPQQSTANIFDLSRIDQTFLRTIVNTMERDIKEVIGMSEEEFVRNCWGIGGLQKDIVTIKDAIQFWHLRWGHSEDQGLNEQEVAAFLNAVPQYNNSAYEYRIKLPMMALARQYKFE